MTSLDVLVLLLMTPDIILAGFGLEIDDPTIAMEFLQPYEFLCIRKRTFPLQSHSNYKK